MDYSVVLFDLKTEGAPSEKPLMLQPVLFCPVLTWVCQELRACGAQRFFAVCDADAREEVLAAAEDFDPHPRLLLNGRGIHAGETFHALFPDGWREITLEMSQKPEGSGCWYISTPGFTHICPIGLFVKE